MVCRPCVSMGTSSYFTGGRVKDLFGLRVMRIVGETLTSLSLGAQFERTAINSDPRKNLRVVICTVAASEQIRDFASAFYAEILCCCLELTTPSALNRNIDKSLIGLISGAKTNPQLFPFFACVTIAR